MSNIILQGQATDLTVLELLAPADLFAPNGTLPVYEAIKQEVDAFVPDMNSAEGRKEIASMAYKIAQSKNFIDKVGKIFNADLKEKTKAVDKERAAIWDKLQSLQDKISKPLDDYKAAEDARVQTHKDAMARLEALTVFDHAPTYEEIRQRQAMFDEFQTREWDEFKDMAFEIITQEHSALHNLGVAAEQAERDRAELEALRAAKAEQDARDAEEARQKAAADERQRIEQEAAAKAKRDAEAAIKAAADKAAKDAAEATAKANHEIAEANERTRRAEEARIAAEAKAKFEAEEAVRREKDRAVAEAKRLADEATARENDLAHHAKINNEVMAALAAMDCVLGDIPAKAITIAIAEGKIPHVKIAY